MFNVQLSDREIRVLIMALETEKRNEHILATTAPDPVIRGYAEANVAEITALRNKLREV